MIGVFDSGHGGLTVLKALHNQFPELSFLYLGDHANVPYGNRSSQEIVEMTIAGVETLFHQGCKLVILGCNTATAIACRHIQKVWLPNSEWEGRNVLGIIAPTVEVATHTPWGMTEPQYPQMYTEDIIAVFATERTIESAVFDEEIKKRCPNMQVVSKSCPELVDCIEGVNTEKEADELVRDYVAELLRTLDGKQPHWAILGCTHFPLVEELFQKHLPPLCRVLSQPTIVARALSHYLERHPSFIHKNISSSSIKLMTTGNVDLIEERLVIDWAGRPGFEVCGR